MYTKLQFGKDLKNMILKRENIEEIAVWSHKIYLDYEDVNDTGFSKLLLTLGMMELGPEFYFSYDRLNEIADDLIAGNDVNLDY